MFDNLFDYMIKNRRKFLHGFDAPPALFAHFLGQNFPVLLTYIVPFVCVLGGTGTRLTTLL